MKRLILIAFAMLLLGSMGYFAMQNSHSVTLNLFGNFSIQLSVWMVLAGSFVAGWVITEIWQFISHPQRFVQSFLGKFSRYKDNKKLQLTQNFEDASLLRDPKQVRKNFSKLDNQETPLSIRVQYLELLRYEKNAEEMLNSFAELRNKYQGNLQVLLPYLKLACELSEWDLAERLSHEIIMINPGHPDALAGLRQVHIVRQNWVACIEQEKELLNNYSGSLITYNVSMEHEDHLKKAIRQDPKFLKNWSFRYLSQKRDRKNDKPFEAIGEANQLQKSGMFLEAAKVLKKAFENTANPELLETLEVVYRKSGAEEQILEIIGGIHKSRQRAVPASLLYAKLLYQGNQLEEASKILGQVNIPSITNKDKKTYSDTKETGPHLNEKWRELNHAIRFLIAIRQERSEDALNEAKTLLREEEILN